MSRDSFVIFFNFKGLLQGGQISPNREPEIPFSVCGLFFLFWGLRGGERRFEGWGFDLPNPFITDWSQRGFGASPNLVGSHILYLHLHLHSGLLARCCPWFFPTRGFHVNPCVYLRFSIYLAILVDWFLYCLLLVPFCSSSWCMDGIGILCIHEFFDMFMMGIDVLVSWYLHVYSLLWSLDNIMFEELMQWGCFVLCT